MLVALLAAALAHRRPPGRGDTCATAVEGHVRAESTGDPVVDARAAASDAAVSARADSAGAYLLCLARAGRYGLRFDASGYLTQRVDVQVRAGVRLRLDVLLTAEPARLGAVRIVASPPGAAASGASGGRVADLGAWHAAGAQLRDASVLDEADLVRLLTTVPEARGLPDGVTGLHVRGGAAAETRYLVDGAPVYSPVHPGALASAIAPDVVAQVTLHDVVPPARFGGALSSVLDVHAPGDPTAGGGLQGDVGPTALGGTVRVALVPGRGTLFVSGRHTYAGLDRDRPASSVPDAWSDRFAKLAVHSGANDLSLSVFAADNVVQFPGAAASPVAVRDRFAWTSSTVGAVWARPLGGAARGASLDAHAWHARLRTEGGWQSGDSPRGIRGTLDDDGLSAALTLPGLTVGTELRRLATGYTAVSPFAAAPFAAAPVLVSSFVDGRWRLAGGATLDGGLRETVGATFRPLLEPRVALRLAPTAGVTLALGYARTHQFSQSLRNEESLLATVVGADPEVATDGHHVPVAVADQLSAVATIALPWRTRLQLDAYARRLGGLLLVAPVTAEPFAPGAFAVGGGSAWGTSASIVYDDGRLTLQGHYAVGQSVRRVDAMRWHPSFAPDQSALVAAGYRIAAHTSLRAAFWTASNRATTVIGDDIAWENHEGLLGLRQLAGTPVAALGALDGEHLPLYLRMDVGVRHTVPLRHARSAVTMFASLDNALARENVSALVLAQKRHVEMVPLSVILGLSWRY